MRGAHLREFFVGKRADAGAEHGKKGDVLMAVVDDGKQVLENLHLDGVKVAAA
ncbi:hypothetical protein SDC9_104742 [bioreactor metagenome]|uniref:Uncharacterized protein n=1 Tax=bioreactor metagenome TaxID=1076179 RepID=A0A645B432_9ZZZZ